MSDDDQTLPAAGGRDDDDLVGPRRGGASRPNAGLRSGGSGAAGPEGGEDELVGRRRTRFALDDDDEDDVPTARPRPARALSGGGRTGPQADDSMLSVVRDVPRFLKMLVKLMRDGRVSKVDKAIVGAAVAYMALPIDLVPEAALPVLGYVEDVYLLALAVSRMMNNAGIEVLLEHWDGDSASLQGAMAALDRAGAALPAPLRSIVGGRS